MHRRSVLKSSALAGAIAAAAVRPLRAQPAEKLDSVKFREAVSAGDLARVTSFLDRDPALIYARDAKGDSMFTIAALAGHTNITAEFRRRSLKPDIFEAAASGDRQRIIELLNAAPGLVRARSASDRTAMHYAAAGGHDPAVLELQSRGADLDAGPEPPLIAGIDTPKLEAAADIAQRLVGNGANPDVRAADGRTAVEIARARGNTYVVELLDRKSKRDHYALRHSQDITGKRPQPDDVSALPVELINHFVGRAHSNLEDVKRLLKLCPALVWVRATFDEMAVEAGAHMGFLDMVDLLTNRGAPVSTCTATVMGMTDFVRKLIATDPNCVRERGAHDFPLMYFTAFGKERAETAEVLLKAGADPNAHRFGETALHLAARKGYVELARVLLAHGADPRMQARRIGTPLEVAEKSGMKAVAELLR